MKRLAGGAQQPKTGKSVRPRVDQKIYFPGGFVMLKYAEKGRALLLWVWDDGREPYFSELEDGWKVA